MAVLNVSYYLYRSVPWPRDQNALVENLDANQDILGEPMASGSTKLLWPKGIRFELRTQLSQDEFLSSGSSPQYVMIVTPPFQSAVPIVPVRSWYAYVESVAWAGNGLAVLSCRLDVLNTFAFFVKSSLSPKTRVIREHVDRFFSITEGTPRPAPNWKLMPTIDYVPEGIEPELVRTSFAPIELADARLKGVKWYLVYETREDLSTTDISNPIDCFLAPEKQIPYKETGGTGETVEWNTSNHPSSGVYYYVTLGYGTPKVRIASDVAYDIVIDDGLDIAFHGALLILYWSNETSTFRAYLVRRISLSSSPEGVSYVTQFFGNLNTVIFTQVARLRVSAYLTFDPNEAANSTALSDQFIWSGYSGQSLMLFSISALDRTQSRNMKVVELPYPPLALSYSGDDLQFDEDAWEYDSGRGWLHLKKLETSLQCEIASRTIDLSTKISARGGLGYLEGNMDPARERFVPDPKLLCSEFHSLRFAYDSFAVDIPMEAIDLTAEGAGAYTITYVQSSAVSSKLMFQIDVTGRRWQDQDFPDLILSSRGNEIPLYNNDYVDYIRNGYNYDLKARSLQAANSYVQAFLGGGQGGVLAGVSSNPYARAAQEALSFSGSIASTIFAQAQFDVQMAKRLQGNRAKATSVSGVDDLDLFREYGKQALIGIAYDPLPITKERIEDLFYYAGYRRDVFKVPDFSSRYWFNYVEAEVLFDPSKEGPIVEYEEEIRRLFRAGVTIFHPHSDQPGKYDFSQTKENWEVSILNQLEEN